MKIKEENFALTWDEIDLLILQATDLLNRDSVLFNRMLWATEIAGSDDYKSILKAVPSYLQMLDAEITSEIEQAMGP